MVVGQLLLLDEVLQVDTFAGASDCRRGSFVDVLPGLEVEACGDHD